MGESQENSGNREMNNPAADGAQAAPQDEIAQLQRQRDDYLDQLQRSRAEFLALTRGTP